MMNSTQHLKGVHLVGSIPLGSAENVFRTTSSILGQQVQRLPDGETGDRTNWIGWQFAVFAANPYYEMVAPDPEKYAALPYFKLRSGVSPAEITFGPLGYAAAAKESYAIFSELKAAGAIPATTRFQVSLPTPLAPVVAFVAPEDQAATEAPYEAQLLSELNEILEAIPHNELAIQWDVAVEFGILEGIWTAPFSDLEAGITERLVRLSNVVPEDVELGYHLCYGDAGHQHFKQPEDTSRLVQIGNGILEGIKRPVNWLHLPVPRNRTDDAYFAPLRDLKLHPETELYLGLVHYTDGVEGTQKRIEAAQKTVPNFGVATECGMGRRASETIPDLLRIHSKVLASA